MVTTQDIRAENRPYRPYGACAQLWWCRLPQVVVSGPAGTGKSRAILERMHFCAERYPGFRGLICRKTRASLTETGLVTFEDKVVPEGHPILEGAARGNRRAYHYPNGSEIVVGGMDKPSKIMSSEYDLIFVQEAIELNEGDWDNLTTRLRNNKMPHQQILADTNPDSPRHWLKRRSEPDADGKIKTLMLHSRHEDNPTLFDLKRKTWTELGVQYIALLDDLTGPRRLRLRFGRWVQSEGVVYENYDQAIHVIDRFEVPLTWPRYWSVDFGYTNPFVWQCWATDEDQRLYLLRQIYMSQRLVEDHARRIVEIAQEELPERMRHGNDLGQVTPHAIVCDHDAEGRATLERHLGLSTVAANKDKRLGIQAVAERLKVAGDGRPRIFFLRDSLDIPDRNMLEKKKPTSTEEEFDSYIWKPAPKTAIAETRNEPDEPIDKDNHGMDGMRYMAAYFAGGIWKLPDPKELDQELISREQRRQRLQKPWDQDDESRADRRNLYGRGR